MLIVVNFIFEEDWALVVKKRPQQMRLIKEFHEGAGGGHFVLQECKTNYAGSTTGKTW